MENRGRGQRHLVTTLGTLRHLGRETSPMGHNEEALGPPTRFKGIAGMRPRPRAVAGTPGGWPGNAALGMGVRYYTLLYVTIRYYTLLYVTIRYYTLLYVTIRYYTLLYVTIRY